MKGVCHYIETPVPHVRVEVKLSGKDGGEIRDKFFPGSDRISFNLFRESNISLSGDEFKPTIEQMKEMDGKIIPVDTSRIAQAQAEEPWEFMKDDPDIKDAVETDADHDANYLFFEPKSGVSLSRQRFNFHNDSGPYFIRPWVSDTKLYSDQFDSLLEECIKMRYRALYVAYSLYLKRCDSDSISKLKDYLSGSIDDHERIPLERHVVPDDPSFLGEAIELAYEVTARNQLDSFFVMKRIAGGQK